MTITVTPTVEASNVPPRVRLDVSASAGETSATVVRKTDAGVVATVRTSDGGPLPISGGTGLVYDSESFFGQAVTYSTLESPGTVSAAVTVDASSVWLIHPGVTALSVPVELRSSSLAKETYDVQQGIAAPSGNPFPTVTTDGARKAMTSALIVAADTPAQVQGLKNILADAAPLLLNIPPSLGYLVNSCYIAVGSVDFDRVTDIGADPYRAVSLPFQVVDVPFGGQQPLRTYANLLVFDSYDAMKAAYADYAALLAGP